MANLNEFYKKIDMYFMKRGQESRKLVFLDSSGTHDNNNEIDDICKSMANIFKTYNIPIMEKASINDQRCVQSYKFLLLNTSFESQSRLEEDIVNGYLVCMCPPLPPYVFLKILWYLEYENILIESLLYIPFDLCIEIVHIVERYIDTLPIERSIKSIYQLILIIYTKFFRLYEVSVQSTSAEYSINYLLYGFEKLLLLLRKQKLYYLRETSIKKKYELHGVMLKKLICTTRQCLEMKNKGILISRNLEKLYNVTFGREKSIKCENTLIENYISRLNQQLMDLLLVKVEEINCNIYLSWAELNDEENNMITLQRSIGIECYYFKDFVLNDEELSKNTHLIECLQQLSCKSNPTQTNFVLSLQELCCIISSGKKEAMKELLYRYKEWDLSILNFIYENRSLLETEDCLILLQYLTFVLTQSTEEDSKEFSYTLIIKILSYQNIINLYKIVMMYLMEHNGKSYLECSHTYDAFHEFITRNANFRTPVNLKLILLFLLKNPQMILTILLKITIGHPHYGNIMISPNDLLLLSPFMQMREGNNQTLVTSILRVICIENTEWNAKKFINFVNVMLENSVIEVHDLINNVYIPYLNEDTFNVSNINFVLNSIRKLQVKCNKNTNVKDLIIALAKRMSFLRKNTNILKHISNEIFVQIIRILPYLLENKGLFNSTKTEIINRIESIVEPIDKLHFGPLWYLMQKGVSIIDIIEDYERRFVALNRLKEDSKTSEKLRNYLSDLILSREDILRHLIIRSTEEEYQRLGSEFTIMYYFIFGCDDEIDAYNNFLRLTIEACCLCLEYPSVGENDLFPFLFKSFIRFCRTFVSLDGIEDYEKVYRSLIKNINQLDNSIRHSPYAHLFTTYLSDLDNHTTDNFEHILHDVLNVLHHFSNQCLECNEYNEETCDLPHSLEVSNFYKTYSVISTCTKIPATEACMCINKMNELFVF